jgi:sugar phosphate permease
MVWVWARGIGGVVALLLGVLWILQGLNVIHGSGMSGHAQFVVLGIVAALFGVWLLSAVLRARPGAAGR